MFINKFISFSFRMILLTMIVVNYFYFVVYTWLPLTLHNKLAWVVIFLFHFILIMVIWTILVTSTSDPGQVPLYWGFYLGDSDSKRRRYCLMCNVFKPDRCHHCSICNRCVLNMDHHCPWINNCIGFFNRKYFMQMLFYMNVTLLFVLLVNFKFTLDMVLSIVRNKVNLRSEMSKYLGYIFVYIIDIGAQIIIGLFFKFHLNLVLQNKTTIETIDKKGIPFESMYDRGYTNNFLQVMGNSKLLWFLPLKIYLGIPKGNGIDWHEPLLDEKKLTQNENTSNNPLSNYNSKASVYKSNFNKENVESLQKSLPVNASLSSLYKIENIKSFQTNQPDSITNNTNKPTAVTNPETTSRLNQTSSQIELLPNSRSTSPIIVNEGNLEKDEEEQKGNSEKPSIELTSVKINSKTYDAPKKI